MKLKLTTLLLALALPMLNSCGDKEKADDHAGHDHSGHDHDAHAGHDHAKGEGHHDGETPEEHAKHADKDDHSQCGVSVGPNGGRMLVAYKPNVEFVLTADNKVKLTFLGDDGQPVASEAKSVRLIIDGQLVETTADGASLVSGVIDLTKPVLAQVSIKDQAGKKFNSKKFELAKGTCDKCSHQKYACICHNHDHTDDDHDDPKGHNH